MNSIASRVLPIPGSPSSRTSWRLPSVARSRYWRRRSSSPRRPTKAPPLRVAKKAWLPSGCAARRRRGGRRLGRGLRALGLQHPLELGLDLRAGGDAELVAQQRAQPLVDAQRLDEVALRLAHAHQQQVAALAEGRELHQLLGGALGRRQLGAADRQAGVAAQLARLQPELLEPAPRILEPGRLVAGQQPGVGKLGDAAGGLDDGRPVAAVACREGLVERGLRLVEVDGGGRGELHGALARVLDHFRTERAPQLREHDVERLGVTGRGVLAPQGGDHPLTGDPALAVEREMGERQPALTAGQIRLPAASIDADREMATQFDGHLRGWQRPASFRWKARLAEPSDRRQTRERSFTLPVGRVRLAHPSGGRGTRESFLGSVDGTRRRPARRLVPRAAGARDRGAHGAGRRRRR